MSIKTIIRNKVRNTKLYDFYSVAIVGCKDVVQIVASFWYRLYPVQRNKIVFSSFNGTSYNGQPFEISTKLLIDDGRDIVWILPESIASICPHRSVTPNSIRAVYELMTAGVWIDNCRKKFWVRKRNNQLYIQTWHGPVCLKAIEKDAERTLPPFYVYGAKRDSKNANYIVSETEWRTTNIQQSFWYNGKIVKGEFKKNYNYEQANKKVRDYYSLNENTKILLYAPTFREDNSVDNYLNNFDEIVSTLEEKTNYQWVVIIRMHPNVASRSDYISYDTKKINGTLYPCIDDLIVACDYLITDYSGCIFEGYRAMKKVIIYAKDYEHYIREDRSMYFDLRKLPSPFTCDCDSLIKALLHFSNTEYEKKRETFVEELGYYEANAAELCVDLVNNYIEEGKIEL